MVLGLVVETQLVAIDKKYNVMMILINECLFANREGSSKTRDEVSKFVMGIFV